ncbi:MAG: 2-phosphosulfolactate phosphatase [Homoserinimonas sp.]
MTSQSVYQVRFDWGSPGVDWVGDGADAVIWVDQLASTPRAVPEFPVVVAGGIQNRAAVARWVLAQQARKGDRFTVAVVAAGELRLDGSLRFAVEDLIGAGAVIDSLASVGVDYCSPEAAAACAAYTGLSGAAAHLISASESGLSLGGPLLDLAPVDEVPVLP